MKLHWIKDPSVQFILIGAMLFGVNSLFTTEGSSSSESIVVTENRIQHLATIFERGWHRPPNSEELQNLIDDFVREEILYREATKMQLDRDDSVIRRRMRMKMELLAQDLVDAINPSEQVLKNYFQKNIQRYTRLNQYTFQQIFLDSDKRTEVAEDVRFVLTQLTTGADPRKLGDSNLLQYDYRDINAARIDGLFGGSFALQLEDLPAQQWMGPVTSAYGEHLVRIVRRSPERQANFDEIQAELLRDWQSEQQKKILQTQYDTLRASYRVQFEKPIAGAEVSAR